MNIFERASRNKLRFSFRGQLSVEDLWDLNVEQLDSLYKILSKEKKVTEEESLLSIKTTEETTLDLKIEIIKHIVTSKLSDAERIEKAKITRTEKKRLEEIIARKKDAALENLSIEELEARKNNL